MQDVLDDELQRDFEDYVSYHVGRNYSRGLLSKPRLRKKLTKLWNGRGTNAGIPGEVKRTLGAEKSKRLFQDIVDDILSNEVKLKLAIDSARTQDMFNQID